MYYYGRMAVFVAICKALAPIVLMFYGIYLFFSDATILHFIKGDGAEYYKLTVDAVLETQWALGAIIALCAFGYIDYKKRNIEL